MHGIAVIVSLEKYTAALHNYIRYDVLTGDYNADYIITKVQIAERLLTIAAYTLCNISEMVRDRELTVN